MTTTKKEELFRRICEATVEVEKARDAKRYWARNGMRVARAISSSLDDINDGVECATDKDRIEELRSDLTMCIEKLFEWQETMVKRQAALEDLRRAQSAKQAPENESKQPVGLHRRLPMTASEVAAEQEKGAAYGYDAKGNRVSLGASPSRLKPEEVTSDQELEQVARQAIRAEQIYQKVAAELKAAQSTSEASCSDSSVLQR